MIEFSAITLEDNYITFNLGDCPTMLKLNVMYLAAKPGSELFYEDTVVRVDKQYGYAEGDRVLNSNNKCIGYIIYNQGFRLQDMRGNIKELREYKHIKVEKGTHSDRAKIIASENRDKILISTNDKLFTMNALVDFTGSTIIIRPSSKQFSHYNIDDLRIWTGIEKFKFYDCLDGGRIVLFEGLPCVQFGNQIIKLSEYGGISDETC